MKLSSTQVKLVCQKLLTSLRAQKLITLHIGEAEILKKMEKIFIDDLKVEGEIDKEVEKILQQNLAQLPPTVKVDADEMFRLIKKQLIKDRKVVI